MPLFHRRSRRTRENPPPQPWASARPVSGLLTEQRTYLPDAPYLLPKDAQEDQRLTYQHHVLYRTLSNHYLAPLSPETATRKEPASEQRDAALVDLAALKHTLERLALSFPPRPITHALW